MNNEATALRIPEIRQEIDLLHDALSDMTSAIDDTEKRLDDVMRRETPTPPEEATLEPPLVYGLHAISRRGKERPASITLLGNTVREMRNDVVRQCKRLHSILNRVEI